MASPISKLARRWALSPVSSLASRNACDRIPLNRLGAQTNSAFQIASPSSPLNSVAATSS